MCGIFGVYCPGKLGWNEISNARQLGFMSALRGVDSTGVMVARRKPNKKFVFDYMRDTETSPTFLSSPDVMMFMHQDDTFLVCGHTRKATCGDINVTNAQPVHSGKIMGCHNGTVQKWAPTTKHDSETTTDSKVLIKTIDKDGVDDALDEAYGGAWALAYVNMQEQTLNFVRNYQRPLHYMWNNQRTVLYWASEAGMLELLREREGKGSFGEVFNFSMDELYTIPLGSLEVKRRNLKVAPTAVTVFRPLTRSTDTSGLATVCSFCKMEDSQCICTDNRPPWYGARPRPITSVPSILSLPSPKAPMPVYKEVAERLYRGWSRNLVHVSAVWDILKYGCTSCMEPQRPDVAVHWISPHKVVCTECMKDRVISSYLIVSNKQMFLGKMLDGTNASNVSAYKH